MGLRDLIAVATSNAAMRVRSGLRAVFGLNFSIVRWRTASGHCPPPFLYTLARASGMRS